MNKQPWTPDQWAKDDDGYPGMPEWGDTLSMIERTFGKGWRTICADIELDDWGVVPKKKYADTIVTIAYCCLRGLTVRETLRYFGKHGRGMCDYGFHHPVRAVEMITHRYRGNPPMSNFVSFPGGVNPLAAMAA